MFSSRSFMVSGLIFKPSINFEFIFVCNVVWGPVLAMCRAFVIPLHERAEPFLGVPICMLNGEFLK